MNPKPKLTTLALTAAALSGLLLAGCGEQPLGTSSTSTTPVASGNTDAQQQFLDERKGTPDPNFTPVVPMGGPIFFNGPQGGAFGNVQKIDGRNITLLNPTDNSTKLVHLADSAKIMTQAGAALSDIKVGDTISAVGEINGDTVDAATVQLGGMNGPLNTFGPGPGSVTGPNTNSSEMPNGGSNTIGGQPPQGTIVITGTGDTMTYGTPGPVPNGVISATSQIIMGEVESIDGLTIQIKTPEGKNITINTTPTTEFHKEAELPLSDLKEGMVIAAEGEQKGDTFEATSATVLPALRIMKP